MPFLIKAAHALNGPHRSFLSDGPPVGGTTTLGLVDRNGPDFRSTGDVKFFRDGGIAKGDQGFLIEPRGSKWIVAAQLVVLDVGEEGNDRWNPTYEVVDRDFSNDDVAELCAAYLYISEIPHLENNGEGMTGRAFLPLTDVDFEDVEAIIHRPPVYNVLEYENPSSLGEEVAYGSRAGCSVGVYEIDGLYFVEWSCDEGMESGWEEIDVAAGPGREDALMAHVASYLNLHSSTVDPKEETFGLVNDAGPPNLNPQTASKVGSVIFHSFDDDQLPGFEIWEAEQDSLFVTRRVDGAVLGGFADLTTIQSQLTSPHPSYRPYLVSPGSNDWEAWE